MGRFFTLLYILVTYLTPPVLFGPLAEFHIEVILVIPTLFFTLIAAQDSGIFKRNQTWGLLGLMMAATLSAATTFGLHFVPQLMTDFSIPTLTYFFVAINFRKKSHLQMLTAIFFVVAVYVLFQFTLAERAGEDASPFFYISASNAGDAIHRMRGLGIIADPNDFAQFLLVAIPCMFLFWSKGQTVRNALLVYLPVAVMLYDVYATHSRGGLLGLAAVCILAGRKKIGVIPSLVIGGFLVVGLMAVGFTGGRDISADSGEDRMQLWDTGLQMIRSHPVFGVGFNHFTDYAPLTAHNTIIVCAAETGLLGFFLWLLFVTSGLRDMYRLGASGAPAVPADDIAPTMRGMASQRALSPSALPAYALAGAPGRTIPDTGAVTFRRPGEIPGADDDDGRPSRSSPFREATSSAGNTPEELRRVANLMVLAFAGFLVTGWFLSRSFSTLLFVVGGMAVVVFRMSQEQGLNVPEMPLGQAMKKTILPGIILLGIVYVILRIDHLRH